MTTIHCALAACGVGDSDDEDSDALEWRLLLRVPLPAVHIQQLSQQMVQARSAYFRCACEMTGCNTAVLTMLSSKGQGFAQGIGQDD